MKKRAALLPPDNFKVQGYYLPEILCQPAFMPFQPVLNGQAIALPTFFAPVTTLLSLLLLVLLAAMAPAVADSMITETSATAKLFFISNSYRLIAQPPRAKHHCKLIPQQLHCWV
jgi:hypothetical protein